MDGPPEDDVCTICHDNFRLPYQANCGHWFCGDCMLQLWEHGSGLEPCKCPLCRREINLLVPSEPSSMQQHTAAISRILKGIERYNRLCAERSTIWHWLQTMRDLPFLLKRLLWDLLDPQTSLPLVFKIRLFVAVKFHTLLTESSKLIISSILCLSPVEIIPASVMGTFGMLDDLIAIFMTFVYMAAIYRAFLLDRHGGNQD